MARREEFKARDNQNSSGDLDAELERLAALSQVQYEHERKGAAKRLNVRASILDRLVEAKRPTTDDGKQGRAISFPEPGPWPDPVDGAELLDGIAAAIRSHVVLAEHARDTAALWVVHAYLMTASWCPRACACARPRRAVARQRCSTCLVVCCRVHCPRPTSPRRRCSE